MSERLRRLQAETERFETTCRRLEAIERHLGLPLPSQKPHERPMVEAFDLHRVAEAGWLSEQVRVVQCRDSRGAMKRIEILDSVTGGTLWIYRADARVAE